MDTLKNDSSSTSEALSSPETEDKPKRNRYAGRLIKKPKKKIPAFAKVLAAILILAALSVGIFFLVDYFLKKDQNTQEITTAVSYRGQLAAYISGWGTAAPKNKVDVSSKTIGKVTDVAVQAGDVVSAGDVLFAVDPADTKEKLETANRKYKDALKKAEDIQKNINELKTYAPFSGRILDAADLTGVESVGAATQLCRLVDDSKMKLTLMFSYGYVNNIKTGMKARVSIAESMSVLDGYVDSVDDVKLSGDEGGIYFEVTVAVDNPGALTEGMSAAAIVIGDKDYYPYNDSELKYYRTENIFSKTSGDIKSHRLRNGYRCAENELLLELENESLLQSLADAKESVSDALNDVNDLREAVNSAVHTSPIDGVVTAVVVNVDDEITSTGGTLVTISDLSEMIVSVNIDESEIDKVSAGTPVSVSFSQSESTKYLDGVVQSVSFEASSEGGGDAAYFPAKIAVKSDGSLMPGMGVNYEINSVLRDDCVIVPPSAVIYTDDGPVVLVRAETADLYDTIIDVDPAMQLPEGFCAVPVEIGISDANSVEIISGIGEDVEVYTQQAGYMDYDSGLLGF